MAARAWSVSRLPQAPGRVAAGKGSQTHSGSVGLDLGPPVFPTLALCRRRLAAALLRGSSASGLAPEKRSFNLPSKSQVYIGCVVATPSVEGQSHALLSVSPFLLDRLDTSDFPAFVNHSTGFQGSPRLPGGAQASGGSKAERARAPGKYANEGSGRGELANRSVQWVSG